MIDFLLFLIGSSGITVVFILASIFEKIREAISLNDFLEELIHCPMCLGFWIGLASSFVFSYNPIYSGFAVSLISWTIFNINGYFITKNNFLEMKMENVNE